MSQQNEEVPLSLHERQALADIWSSLADEERRLAPRFRGGRWARPLSMSTAAVLVVFGVIVMVASPDTSLLLKSMGVASYAVGVTVGVQLRLTSPPRGPRQEARR